MSSIHHETLLAQRPLKQFDMIVSFSSLEHDGIGRYANPPVEISNSYATCTTR